MWWCAGLLQALCCERKARGSVSQAVQPVESHQTDLRVRHRTLQPESRQDCDDAGRREWRPGGLQSVAHPVRHREVFSYTICGSSGLLKYSISFFTTIFHRVLEENNGKPPLTYNSMQAIVKKLGPPKRPISAPSMDDLKGPKTPGGMLSDGFVTDSGLLLTSKGVSTPCLEDHEKKYGIPTLEDLGHDPAGLPEEKFPGGEQEALRRLEDQMKKTVAECDRAIGRTVHVPDTCGGLGWFFRAGCATSRSLRRLRTR